MAYASGSAVAALTKNLNGGEPTYTDTSCPTRLEVEHWLSTGCSLIEVELANNGYDAIPSTSKAYGLASQVNAVYAAWMAERSRNNARGAAGERTRADLFREDYERLLKTLIHSDLSRLGVPELGTTDSATAAAPYAGGIHVDDKESVAADTNRVRPRFGRGMFGASDTPRSGDSN